MGRSVVAEAGWGRRVQWPEVTLVVALVALLVRIDPRRLGDRFIGDLDAKYYGWLAWRLGELDSPAARLDGVVHPAGLELWLLDGLAPIALSGLISRFAGRYLAVNLVILGGITLNYLAARRLASTIGADGWARMVAAAAYAAAPLFAGPAASFPAFLWAFPVPLLLAEVITAARGDRPTRPSTTASLLVLAYLCSVYHLLFGACAVAVVGLTWPQSALRHRAAIKPVVIAVVAAGVVLSPFAAARLRYSSSEAAAGATPTSLLSDTRVFSADVADPLIIPAVAGTDRALRLGLAERPLEAYRSAAVGWALLAGLILAAWRRPRGSVALLWAAGALVVVSWGPRLVVWGRAPIDRDWLVYRAIVAVPGLSALRAPYRAGIVLAAVLCALLALVLRDASRTALVVAVAALVMLSWWPRPPTSAAEPPTSLAAPFAAIAASPSDAAVLVVPFTCGFPDLDVLHWQIAHRHPMVTCGVTSSATRWQTRAAAWFTSPGLAATRCDPSVDVLGRPAPFAAELRLDDAGLADLAARLDVRWVIFDHSRAEGCATAPATLAALTDGAAQNHADERFSVFDLAAT